jgi:hypothetical protein
MRKNISRTVQPDSRLPFNEWIHHIINRRNEIEQLQSPVIRERRRQEIMLETLRIYKNR